MPIDLYYMSGSSPCESVILTAKALGLQLNLHVINLQKNEQSSPEYAKISVQRTVPTLVDNGFSLGESRAINRYLVNKYGKNTNLYPEDIETRALIDQRLDFDGGSLYPSFASYYYPQLMQKQPPNEFMGERFKKTLATLERLLDGPKYAVGDHITLADLCLSTTVSIMLVVNAINVDDYPNIKRWYELVKTTAVGFDEYVKGGLQDLKNFFDGMKSK